MRTLLIMAMALSTMLGCSTQDRPSIDDQEQASKARSANQQDTRFQQKAYSSPGELAR